MMLLGRGHYFSLSKTGNSSKISILMAINFCKSCPFSHDQSCQVVTCHQLGHPSRQLILSLATNGSLSRCHWRLSGSSQGLNWQLWGHHWVLTDDSVGHHRVLISLNWRLMGHHELVTCSHFVPKVVIWQVAASVLHSESSVRVVTMSLLTPKWVVTGSSLTPNGSSPGLNWRLRLWVCSVYRKI